MMDADTLLGVVALGCFLAGFLLGVAARRLA